MAADENVCPRCGNVFRKDDGTDHGKPDLKRDDS
jgi:hypothetical protein